MKLKNSVRILKFPDKRLTSSNKIVTYFKEAHKITDELIEVTKEVDFPLNLWLGMAAPQIGYNLRIIVIRESYKKYRVMVNPEIVEKKWLVPALAQCYSIPGLHILGRYYWIKVKYQDLSGKEHQEVFKGGRSFVVQHELDHLEGKLLGL